MKLDETNFFHLFEYWLVIFERDRWFDYDWYYDSNKTKCASGVPQRINGKVSGSINGVSFHDEDLHSYVVTSDGRAYTAISKIPDTIGYDLQPLSIFGGVVGWLFARSLAYAPNGYQLTGNSFAGLDIRLITKFWHISYRKLVVINIQKAVFFSQLYIVHFFF